MSDVNLTPAEEAIRRARQTTITTEALFAVVQDHERDPATGQCKCGEDWLCEKRMEAARALRKRGAERPPPRDDS